MRVERKVCAKQRHLPPSGARANQALAGVKPAPQRYSLGSDISLRRGATDVMGNQLDHFSTATAMLEALRRKDISSSELTELHIERIKVHDPVLNSIPVPTFERARAAAKAADAALAKGQAGALLGLPMTLKESTLTAGLPQSAGIPALAGYVPAADGPLAASVFAAGAALLGKTNIPVALGDWQADSPVYGRTNNPWDTCRTPGGSTGGGSAALAAGLTPLEVGSDIGGSIRVPAAYCGVYGHRPSETAIPRSGSFPLADHPNPAALMGVQGPLARSATDLELLFDVIKGPEAGEDAAWRLELPAARRRGLDEFRVAVMPALPWVAPAAALQAKVEELAALLSRKGARVAAAMPELDQGAYFLDYLRMLTVQTTQGQTRQEREQNAAAMRESGDPLAMAQADGMVMDATDYLGLVRRRESARQAWQAFFRDWDVVLAPMSLDCAFPHQDKPFNERTLQVDGREVPYLHNLVYPMWAIFAGLPSTAFPAGLGPAGLPLGLQAIGPYLEDRTTLRFASLLEQEWHRFEAPPGY
jgi:amidase